MNTESSLTHHVDGATSLGFRFDFQFGMPQLWHVDFRFSLGSLGTSSAAWSTPTKVGRGQNRPADWRRLLVALVFTAVAAIANSARGNDGECKEVWDSNESVVTSTAARNAACKIATEQEPYRRLLLRPMLTLLYSCEGSSTDLTGIGDVDETAGCGTLTRTRYQVAMNSQSEHDFCKRRCAKLRLSGVSARKRICTYRLTVRTACRSRRFIDRRWTSRLQSIDSSYQLTNQHRS
jgi:hypothetical protein